MADTVVTASMTPASKKTGQSATAPRKFGVSDIPDAMDKMKWPVAAKLMRYWFAGKPWATPDGAMSKAVKNHDALPEAPYFEDSIVKMSWVTGFDRANKVIKVLKSSWNNAAAVSLMQDKYTPKFKDKAPGVYPLKFNGSARAVEVFGYSNSRSVEFDLIDKTDELRAALANFNLRVFVEGKVVVAIDRIQIFVDRIGMYAEDAYDFNDAPGFKPSQPLGYWNFDGIADPVSANAANVGMQQMQSDMAMNPFSGDEAADKMYRELAESRYYYINNSAFVKYRDDFGKGGDFQVLSDVLYESVPVTVIHLWGKE